MNKVELRKHADALSDGAIACIRAVLTKHNMGLIEAAHEHGQRVGETAAPNAGPLNGKYGDVLAPFVALMEAELHANARKGDRPGWLSMTPSTALLEIYWHVAKLSAAVKNNDAALIREHAADVANMSMMLLDVCGGLDVQPNTEVVRREASERTQS
jgi:hypothetical protein